MTPVNREMGAVVHHVQAGGKSAGAPISWSARTGRPAIPPGGNVLEASSKDSHCGAATVTQGAGLPSKGYPAPFRTLHSPRLILRRVDQAGTQRPSLEEPEALESALGAVEGAIWDSGHSVVRGHH